MGKWYDLDLPFVSTAKPTFQQVCGQAAKFEGYLAGIRRSICATRIWNAASVSNRIGGIKRRSVAATTTTTNILLHSTGFFFVLKCSMHRYISHRWINSCAKWMNEWMNLNHHELYCEISLFHSIVNWSKATHTVYEVEMKFKNQK